MNTTNSLYRKVNEKKKAMYKNVYIFIKYMYSLLGLSIIVFYVLARTYDVTYMIYTNKKYIGYILFT